MDIYIPNIKLPKDEPGAFKVIVIYVDTDRKLRAGCEGTHEVTVVPLHGRLIDADALVEDLKRQCEEVFKIDAVSPDDFWITRDQAYNERLWKTWCESFFEYLKTRETIIPESEEEVDEAQRDYQAASDYQQYCEMYEQTYDSDTGAM